MADDNVIGGVSVSVTADLTQYNASLDAAKAKAQAFDQSASQAMGNVEKATGGLTVAQRSMFDQIKSGALSLDQLKSALGSSLAGQEAFKKIAAELAADVRNAGSAAVATAKEFSTLGSATGSAARNAQTIKDAFAGIDFTALNAKLKQTTQMMGGVSAAGVSASAVDIARASPALRSAMGLTAQRAAEEARAEATANKIADAEAAAAEKSAAAQLATRMRLTKQMGAEAAAEAAAAELASQKEAKAAEAAAAQTLAAKVRFNTQAGRAGNAAEALAAKAEARAAKEAAAAEADLAARREKLLASASPLAAAQQKFSVAQTEANALLKAGAITEAEYTAAVAASEAALKKVELALGRSTAAHVSGRVATEGLAAVHEVLQGRMNRLPGTLMIEAQALAGTERTAKFLTAALSPLGLTIAGVTAVTIAGVAAMIAYEKQQRDLLISSAGLGAASGISSGQINQASTVGILSLKSSVNDNVKAMEAYSAAGVRSIATVQQLNGVTQDFAVLTGQKAKDAQKELAAAMKDPVKGAEELNAKLGLLDATQLRQIETEIELGNKAQAQADLTRALAERTAEADKATGGLQGTMAKFGHTLGDVFTGLGQVVSKEAEWATLAAKVATGDFGAPFRAEQERRQREQAQADLQNRAQLNSMSAAGLPLQQATGAGRDETESNKLGGNIFTLNLARQADTQLHGAGSEQVKRDTEALDAYNRAQSTYNDLAKQAAKSGLSVETERQVQMDRLDAEATKAKTSARKGEVAAQKEQLELAGKVMSTADANALVAGARQRGSARDRFDSFTTKDATLDAQIKGELDLADAYAKSDAAAMRAEATMKAMTDEAGHHRTALQAAKIAQDELNLSAAKAAADSAKVTATMQAETSAQRIADISVQAGLQTRKEADEEVKQTLALRGAEAALENATAATKDKFSAALERQKKAQAQANAEAAKALAIDTAAHDADEIAIAKLRAGMVGQPRAKQDVAVARLQRSQQLGPTASATPEGKDSIQSAGDAALAQSNVVSLEQYRQMTLQIQKETEALQRQQATMGMTLEQADKYNTALKLQLEAEKAGIELDAQKRASIDKLADGYAHAADQARKLADAQKGRAQAAKTVGDTVEGGLEGVIFDGEKPMDALRSGAKSLGRDALKATMTGEGPLAGLFGTDQTKTVGGMNGGLLSGVMGSLFGVGKSGQQQAPTGTANDPLYVTMSGGASAGGAGPGGGIMGMIQNLFGSGMGGMGGAPGADTGGALSEMAGLFHTGTSYVGTPARMVPVPPKLFATAPRLHSGLAPDEFPAILQKGERVTAKNGHSPRSGHTTIMNITTNDAASFGRSQRQIERSQKRAMGRPG